MENRLHDTEFEQLLQDETKQHRMYPSDKVWRNIHKEVHGKKSWPALTFLSLMVIAALTVTTILNNHPAQPFNNVAKLVVTESKQPIAVKKKRQQPQEQMFANGSNQQVFPILNEGNGEEGISATTNMVSVEATETALYNPHIAVAPTQTPLSGEVIKRMLESKQRNIEREIKQRLGAEQTTSAKEVTATNSTGTIIPEQEAVKNTKLSVASLQENKTASKSQFKKPVDDNPSEFDYAGLQSPAFLKKNKASRFGFQFYITPSTSYRKLADDKQRNDYQRVAGSGPAALNYSVNVNDVVRHKPAVGIETGFGFTYKATKRLTIKTGIQFNVRQYYIDAFSSGLGIATIAIVSNDKLDTITQFSNFSNTNGYKESKLDTKLFQLSIPVGLQFDILQGRRFGLNVGGSLQPTVTMNKNLYIISTDYKAYTDGTPFLRRWNINSSAELNLTYKVGKTQWHIGPQVRYQHLPTYTDIYPIKEYRLDYGIKLGFIKSF